VAGTRHEVRRARARPGADGDACLSHGDRVGAHSIVGVGPERSATIIRAAAVAVAVERTLELGRGGPSVEGPLRSIRGVGVWTAAETMQRAHGDPDSPSVGDYHVPALVGWALIGKPVDDDGMLELLEPWAGHRQRVVRLIGASGFEKPKFGPRMTIQDHRGH